MLVVWQSMPELSIEQTRLHALIVLVLIAAVLLDSAGELLIEDLADTEPCVNSHRLDSEHLYRPVTAETNIAEPRSAMYEEP